MPYPRSHYIIYGVGGHAYEAYHFVIIAVEGHAAHASGHTSHLAYLVFGESDGATVAVGHEYVAVAVGHLDAEQLVALADDDGVDALGAGT